MGMAITKKNSLHRLNNCSPGINLLRRRQILDTRQFGLIAGEFEGYS